MLLKLLKQINTYKQFHFKLIIIDDHSDKSYRNVISFLNEKNFNCSFKVNFPNYGKANYWKTINRLFEDVSQESFDYAIQIPDDIELCENFFQSAIAQYEAITDKKKICLNLLNDYRRKDKMWTPVVPSIKSFGSYNIIKTGWVDMCYIAEPKFFIALKYRIQKIANSWSANPLKSSGVGMNISQRLFRKGFSFYQVAHSLVIHDDHPSVMHPEHREVVKLITNHNMDQIIFNVASIPSRIYSLKDTIDSIYNQCDVINVFLNGYESVFDFLLKDKIKVFRSQEHGDLGDAGKFFCSGDVKGYYFTGDDDLVYPADYVSLLINEIEKNNRKAVITAHGRVLKNKSHSYYHDFVAAYSCLRDVKKNVLVHCPGTGVTAFHTDTVNISIEDFEYKNMADIWLAKVCNEHNIDVICFAHKEGWIKESKQYYKKHTIYESCHKTDKIQTQIINSIVWRKLT